MGVMRASVRVGMMALAIGLAGCASAGGRGRAMIAADIAATRADARLPFINVRMLIIVRHDDIDVAEKKRMGDATPLTDRGTERSAELEHALKDAGITKIVTSTARRTEETAGPLAKELGITPTAAVSHAEPGGAAGSEADNVVKYLAANGKPEDVVLLVHHHSVIPGLMKDLGYEEPAFVDATEFDRLYVVIPDAETKTYRVLRLRYGGVWGAATMPAGATMPARVGAH